MRGAVLLSLGDRRIPHRNVNCDPGGQINDDEGGHVSVDGIPHIDLISKGPS